MRDTSISQTEQVYQGKTYYPNETQSNQNRNTHDPVSRDISRPPAHFANMSSNNNSINYPPRSMSVTQVRHTHNPQMEASRRGTVEHLLDNGQVRNSQPEQLIAQERGSALSFTINSSGIDTTAFKVRDERGSTAFKNAMRALQERIQELEEENVLNKRKLNETQIQHEQTLEELGKQFRMETGSLKEKEEEIKSDVLKMHDENCYLKAELEKAREASRADDAEMAQLNYQLNRARDDHQAALTVSAMLKKQLQTVDNEKSRHLEENSFERTEFENRIGDLTKRVRELQDQVHKSDSELRVAVEGRADVEEQLNKLVLELSKSEKRDHLVIGELEMKLSSAVKHIEHLEKQLLTQNERYEKDLSLLRKKVAVLEEKSNTISGTYEEKMMVCQFYIIPY